MAQNLVSAVITYHKPGTQPPLYVAGTFSDPPWLPQEMDHTARKDGEYNFKKEIRAEPRSRIQYKFLVGDGEWVLKDDGPTTTDSFGNTNHVLEVGTQEEASNTQAQDREGTRDRGESRGAGRLSYAKVAAKQFEPPAEQASAGRSGTGTPMFARTAAEVADSSAELLHEEVPELEKPEGNLNRGEEAGRRNPDAAEPAPKVADASKKPEKRQSTVVILEPPAGEGRPFRVRPQSEEFPDDQEGTIADKPPLFAHECAGMYEMDDELTEEEGGDAAHTPPPIEDIDPNSVDLNDPTLEHFPSSREDIIDRVQKLKTGLRAGHASFSCKPPSPVVNPSRRGTEDITGDFLLVNHQSASPTTRRASKNTPRGSVGSFSATASLHSISEDEEAVEDEIDDRPAVVFSNPLKPRPKHLNIPTSDEDERIALRESVSLTALKPPRASAVSSEGSSPPSPKTVWKDGRPADLTSAEVELGKDKDRSMQEVKLHPAPQASDPGPGQTGPETRGEEAKREDTEVTESPVSYAGVAATKSAGVTTKAEYTPGRKTSEGPGESKTTTSQGPRRLSYAEVAASKPAEAEAPSEGMPKGPKPPRAEHRPESGGGGRGKDRAAPHPSGPRRPSYAEVAASRPPPPPPPPPSSDDAPKAQPAPPTSSAGAESSASKPATTDTSGADRDQHEGGSTSKDLRKRAGGAGGGTSGPEPTRTSDSGGGVGVPAVHPKYGAGWVRAMFRLVFVDLVGGAVKRVLRLFGLDRLFGAGRGRESERDA